MKNFVISGNAGLPISFDIQLPSLNEPAPLIIFLHGFKGFKDWGQWPLMAQELTNRGYAVLRMNFSHNGTSPESPLDFVDLEAFGRNTFSKETQDVQDVLDWLFSGKEDLAQINLDEINLVAHSRGGAIAMITANEDARICKLITLSGVGSLVRFNEAQLAHWEKEGVVYMLNDRTNQNMPLYYDMASDYIKNEHRFNLYEITPKITQPFLIIHAENDETVPLSEGQKLADLGASTSLIILPGANHSFGGKHPFKENQLPSDTQCIVDYICEYL